MLRAAALLGLGLCLLVPACNSGNTRRRNQQPVQQANFQGTWGVTMTKNSSTCGLATGQQTTSIEAWVQTGNLVLIRGGQVKGSVNARRLTYTTVEHAGPVMTQSSVNLAMSQDGQSFGGNATVTTTDGSTSPAQVCVEEFGMSGNRAQPPQQIALPDFFPLNDGDSYEFADGSTIRVVRNPGIVGSITITYSPPNGAPATSWVLGEAAAAPGFLELQGLSRFDGVQVDQEQFVDGMALPSLVPLPLTTLFPLVAIAGDPPLTAGGRLEGTVGDGSGARYGGRSDFTVSYTRVAHVATMIGTFPDTVEVAVTEVWDKKTAEPGPGRPDGTTMMILWLGRNFGPVGLQLPGQVAKQLRRATINGVTEGS
jgi:hypothetical protein